MPSRGRFSENVSKERPRSQAPNERYSENAPIESDPGDGFDPPRQNVIWRFLFLLFVAAYIGVSGYVASVLLWGSISDGDSDGSSTSNPTARSFAPRADGGNGQNGELDLSAVEDQWNSGSWVFSSHLQTVTENTCADRKGLGAQILCVYRHRSRLFLHGLLGEYYAAPERIEPESITQVAIFHPKWLFQLSASVLTLCGGAAVGGE